MANQDLVYDITKVPNLQRSQEAIYGRVGDGGLKAITVKVLSNQTDYNLTGLTPRFEGVKADGTVIIDSSGGTILEPQEGLFRYVFPPQAFTAKGDYVQAFFKLMRGNQTDSTIDLVIHVQANLVEFGINSTTYLTEYQQLIEQLHTKEADFEKQSAVKLQAALNRVTDLSNRLNTLQGRLDANDFISKVDLKQALQNHALIDQTTLKPD
ncbi:phage baseplate upper protein [Lactiplantibacillus plantarum]|uniref:phage baseplate upper protein n=1 Tax=Lactiplantibacillus TaxID=2767842 RepID=UPI0015EB5B03|nr:MULTISPECIES: phage baseplate upper protein [Lactiplantibacillus]MDV0431351.1 phage baseplate upper protein [Lactiplantibacillus sp. DA1]QLQ49146.1 phage baseplate upper protein [Lactiplantibacillus plantarum]WDQ19936.1 phage baseplate upper protein [Lactiplantibacillus plantarum]